MPDLPDLPDVSEAFETPGTRAPGSNKPGSNKPASNKPGSGESGSSEESEVQTRGQRLLAVAYTCVVGVAERADPELAAAYAAVARDFAVAVRMSGLAQVVAFAESKRGTTSPSELAYSLLLDHLAALLDLPDARLVRTVETAPAGDYLVLTRQVLEAWSYLRRFVISILRAEPIGLPSAELS